MEENLKEFKRRVKKVDGPRRHRVKNSLGIRDAFLYLQSNKWFDIGQSLKESTFQQIIREVNNLLAFEIMEGRSIVFPEHMGSLEVRKHDRYVDIDGNKIKTNYMVDWDQTLKLWSEDEEAYQKKTLVRDINSKERYTIFYNRKGANFNNKGYFLFRANRSVYRVLGQNIKKGQVDAYSRYGNAIH